MFHNAFALKNKSFLTHFQLSDFDITERIAQVLQRNCCKLFAQFKFFLTAQQVIQSFARYQGLFKNVYFIIFGIFVCKHFYFITLFNFW